MDTFYVKNQAYKYVWKTLVYTFVELHEHLEQKPLTQFIVNGTDLSDDEVKRRAEDQLLANADADQSLSYDALVSVDHVTIMTKSVRTDI